MSILAILFGFAVLAPQVSYAKGRVLAPRRAKAKPAGKMKLRPARGTLKRSAFRKNLLGSKLDTANRLKTFFARATKARDVTEYVRLLDRGKIVEVNGVKLNRQTAIPLGVDSSRQWKVGKTNFNFTLAVDGRGRIWEIGDGRRLWKPERGRFNEVRSAVLDVHRRLADPKTAPKVEHLTLNAYVDKTPKLAE